MPVTIELDPEIEKLDISTLQQIIKLGYQIYKNGLADNTKYESFIQEQIDIGLSEKTLEYSKSLKDKDIYIESLLGNIDDKITAAIHKKDLEISALNSSLLTYKNLFYEKDAICSVLKEREEEIKTLKNTNHVKCFLGENLVQTQLANWYPADSIEHTGKNAHEGDIHWFYEKKTVLIECKYKKQIQKIDVDKFYSDLKSTNNLSGGIFISIVTPNIPTKGDSCIELLDNMPIMFLGFSSEEDFTIRAHVLFDIFKKIVVICQVNKSIKNDTVIDRCFLELNFILSTLSKNLIKFNEFKANFMKFYESFLADNNSLVTRIEKILVDNSRLITTNSFDACPGCDQVFDSKRKLLYHQKKCDIKKNII